MPIAAGQTLKSRYRIDGLLGQGGMGAVYRARDMSLDIWVAVKENSDTSREALQQFEREARMLAHLTHPSLPRVTDHFLIPGQGQYLVMDYIEGQDLQTLVNQRGALPEAEAMPWIMQICDALSYLHSQSPPIIHRDIKPANVKIRSDGQAMLVDFGIAKMYSPHLATTVGAKAYTPGYSPPEQYGSGATDPRSDIYALGATIYHLLTGQKPPESLQRMIDSVPTYSPRQLNPQISPPTEQAILRAMEVVTSRRFQQVQDLRAALSQSPTQRPTRQAAPPPLPTAEPTTRKPVALPPRVQTAPPPRPVTKKKSSIVMPLLLATGCLIFSLVACIVVAFFFQSQAANTARANVTATAFIAIQTRSAAATAQAKATATTQAIEDNQSKALRTGSQWPLVLRDTFDDNANNWSVQDFDNEWMITTRRVSDGKYRWKVTARKGVLTSITADAEPVDDFYLSVDAKIVNAPADSTAGLIFRNTDSDKYVFLIKDNRYTALMRKNDIWTTLIPWTVTTALQAGQSNKLTIVGEGSHFSFYINETFVDEAQDSEFTSGKVGLGIELHQADEQGSYEFDNFELRTP